MGLREKKAQRSHDRIIAEAMTLFAAHGYEQTTMEAIAEAADISPSTLYRYFPSKDLIVLASFTANTARFAEVFAQHMAQPATEGSAEKRVERALAEAIFAVLAVEDKTPKHALLVRSILGQSPATRARLWDYLGDQQRALTRLLAKSLNRPEDDPALILTSRIALEVLLAAADIWRASKGRVTSRATAENLMQLLRTGAVLFPIQASKTKKTPYAASRTKSSVNPKKHSTNTK